MTKEQEKQLEELLKLKEEDKVKAKKSKKKKVRKSDLLVVFLMIYSMYLVERFLHIIESGLTLNDTLVACSIGVIIAELINLMLIRVFKIKKGE